MLNQSIPTNHLIYITAVYIAERKLKGGRDAQHDLGVVFDLLRMIGLSDNALFMLYQDRAEELDLEERRNQIKCQVCQDAATGLVRTKGGTLLTVCPKCSRDLQRCGAILLLGTEIFEAEEEPDLIQSLRDELVEQGA